MLGGALATETPFNLGQDSIWAFPSVPIAKASGAWDILRRAAYALRGLVSGIVIRESELSIKYPRGGTVRLRTADNPDSLRGAGLGRAVLDEAALLPQRVWSEIVRPQLADHAGDAWFLTSPAALWVHQLKLRGDDPQDTDWAAWNYSMFDNPLIPESEKDAIREEYRRGRIPEHVWQREIMGLYVEIEGAVFRRILQAARSPETTPQEGHTYTIGVDLAKSDDFSTFSIWDTEERRQVYLERHRDVDYVVQEAKLSTLADRYNRATLVIETNSAGVPFVERMERRGYHVRRVHTGPTNKGDMVEDFALAVENGEAAILDPEKCRGHVQECARIQIGELQSYQRVQLPSGRYRYTHPDGGHDDTVDAAWIAWTEMSPAHDMGALFA